MPSTTLHGPRTLDHRELAKPKSYYLSRESNPEVSIWQANQRNHPNIGVYIRRARIMKSWGYAKLPTVIMEHDRRSRTVVFFYRYWGSMCMLSRVLRGLG